MVPTRMTRGFFHTHNGVQERSGSGLPNQKNGTWKLLLQKPAEIQKDSRSRRFFTPFTLQ